MKDVVVNMMETRYCTVSDQDPVVKGQTLIKRTRTLRVVAVVFVVVNVMRC